MSITRRQLLNRSAATGVGVVAATAGLSAASPEPAAAAGHGPGRMGDPRKLFPPLEADAGDLLALPRGFSYSVVAVSGQTDIHDGTGKLIGKTPERPDGTGVVQGGGRLRLLQTTRPGRGRRCRSPWSRAPSTTGAHSAAG